MKDKVRPLIEAGAKDYAEKNTGWPKRTESLRQVVVDGLPHPGRAAGAIRDPCPRSAAGGGFRLSAALRPG